MNTDLMDSTRRYGRTTREVFKDERAECGVIKCRIRLGFGPGIAGVKLTGLFTTTCDAVAEALDRFPGAVRVSVVCLRSEA